MTKPVSDRPRSWSWSCSFGLRHLVSHCRFQHSCAHYIGKKWSGQI